MSTKEEISNELGAVIDSVEEVVKELVAVAYDLDTLTTKVNGIKSDSDGAVTVLVGEGVSGAEFEAVSEHLKELVTSIGAVKSSVEAVENEATALRDKAEEIQTEINTIGG